MEPTAQPSLHRRKRQQLHDERRPVLRIRPLALDADAAEVHFLERAFDALARLGERALGVEAFLARGDERRGGAPDLGAHQRGLTRSHIASGMR